MKRYETHFDTAHLPNDDLKFLYPPDPQVRAVTTRWFDETPRSVERPLRKRTNRRRIDFKMHDFDSLKTENPNE